jgi:hypothetical protein
MLAGDLANPAEETLGGRAATAIGADAAGPRPEVILVILAHRHRCRRSTQKHNKNYRSAAKSCANIDVCKRAALRRLLDGAARRLPTSVQTTIFSRDGPRWCHPL